MDATDGGRPLPARKEFRIVQDDSSQTSIYVYVILTLSVAFVILALVLSILAFVKAQDQPIVGPTGTAGPTGTSGTFSDFEVPAVVFEGTQLVITAGNLQSQFIVFAPNPPPPDKEPVSVLMPVASTQSGVIYRFYNKSAEGGVRVETQAQDLVEGNINNPIPIDHVGFVVSDGFIHWAINL